MTAMDIHDEIELLKAQWERIDKELEEVKKKYYQIRLQELKDKYGYYQGIDVYYTKYRCQITKILVFKETTSVIIYINRYSKNGNVYQVSTKLVFSTADDIKYMLKLKP